MELSFIMTSSNQNTHSDLSLIALPVFYDSRRSLTFYFRIRISHFFMARRVAEARARSTIMLDFILGELEGAVFAFFNIVKTVVTIFLLEATSSFSIESLTSTSSATIRIALSYFRGFDSLTYFNINEDQQFKSCCILDRNMNESFGVVLIFHKTYITCYKKSRRTKARSLFQLVLLHSTIQAIFHLTLIMLIVCKNGPLALN